MAELPLDPTFAKILLMSKDHECSEEILSIISMLSVEVDSIFYTPKTKKKQALQTRKKFLSNDGDHFVLLNVYNAYIANQCKKEWCLENFVNMRTLSKAKVERNLFFSIIN